MDSEELSKLAECALKARSLDSKGNKPYLIGIAGPPAAGKSTLSQLLSDEISINYRIQSQALPMDGFHHTNEWLDKNYLRTFKGRIDTFDSENFFRYLGMIREYKSNFFWPDYSRKLHGPIDEGFLIEPDTKIFIIEGNYLFSEQGIWINIRDVFDFKIFVDENDEELITRLLERHIKGGKTRGESEKKIEETDMPNANFVRQSRSFADLIVNGGYIDKC